MKRVVLAILTMTVLWGGQAHAQSKVGTTIGQFLRIEPSGRHAALGNAGVGLAGGIETAYYNTGVIGLPTSAEVQFTHSFWFADISYDYAAALLPVGGGSNVFVSITALNSGDIDVRTVDHPLGTGERYNVGDVALGLGYGRRITSRFSAGIQTNFVSERIWHTTSQMLTFNAGTHYRLSSGGASIGFCLSNLGTQGQYTGRDLAIQYDEDPDVHGDNSSLPGEQSTDRFPVPILFRLGVALPYVLDDDNSFLVVVDALHPNDNSESANLGVEWCWHDLFSLRLGYQTLFQENSQQGLTAGFGLGGDLGANTYQFDYAWASHAYLEGTHRLTFVIEF
ncbi:PorV/PorQ family protein [bacterium]|nr:PorV/PorQ family protein [bacterium]MBU1674827.1 PorV/PorQ family protein [bacterium]